MYSRTLAVSLILTAPLSYSFGSSLRTTLPLQLPSYTKPPSATTRIQTAVRDYALWIDGTKWKVNQFYSLGELRLSHVGGDIKVNIDSDRLAAPTSMLRDMVLKGIKKADPNAQAIYEEQRIVNGRQILPIQFLVSTDGESFRVLGYYHGGSSGSIQVIAYTSDSKFGQNLGEITELLDGLEVKDQDVPSSANGDHILFPGLLSITSTISVSYDPTKWRQAPTTDPRFFAFLHSSGHGLAEVGVERQTVPGEFVPEWVLASYQTSHPNAKLLSKEKRTVNGTEVWLVKIDVGDNIDIRDTLDIEGNEILLGCYYNDNGGTIEAEIFADKAFLTEYEKDVMAFFNGLRILEHGGQT
jgi:hypothetical protein